MILGPLRRQTVSWREKGQDVTESELCNVKPARTFAMLVGLKQKIGIVHCQELKVFLVLPRQTPVSLLPSTADRPIRIGGRMQTPSFGQGWGCSC